MGITGSIVVFVCAWWMVFFMTLPCRVRGQWEDDDVVDGTEPGAPVHPGLGKKALVATGGAFVVWLFFWTIVTFELIEVQVEPYAFEREGEAGTEAP